MSALVWVQKEVGRGYNTIHYECRLIPQEQADAERVEYLEFIKKRGLDTWAEREELFNIRRRQARRDFEKFEAMP
jgi:hypothetical protein